ncbi:uncharacterized protein BO66DRAFT_393138 [Aspergillus aculeatinus CBS 121060]|uniref:Uncharacterized protein n=1 Tax=Aspergillus aculeatinus CBS 121060 TaxID=1448322 RepID=A0ACD1H3W4_9EURO|nr:hypothetical protein BO66DRAFT_393138 [Aspergillus aculeatinus CBS 121060]RAH68310.1 hypothetical protein BO66DRAFT_393138 [Aspergillus aculeatinus CBS 121060]
MTRLDPVAWRLPRCVGLGGVIVCLSACLPDVYPGLCLRLPRLQVGSRARLWPCHDAGMLSW